MSASSAPLEIPLSRRQRSFRHKEAAAYLDGADENDDADGNDLPFPLEPDLESHRLGEPEPEPGRCQATSGRGSDGTLLLVTVHSAKELVNSEIFGHPSAYCVVELGDQLLLTQVVQKSANPTWNASREFLLDAATLKSTLRIVVYHTNSASRLPPTSPSSPRRSPNNQSVAASSSSSSSSSPSSTMYSSSPCSPVASPPGLMLPDDRVAIGDVSLSVAALHARFAGKSGAEQWFPLSNSRAKARGSGDIRLGFKFWTASEVAELLDDTAAAWQSPACEAHSQQPLLSPVDLLLPGWRGLAMLRKTPTDDNNNDNDTATCRVCCANNSLSPSVNVLSLPCQHDVCSRCLKLAFCAYMSRPTAGALPCCVGDCSCSIPEHVLKQILTADEHERYLQASLQYFMHMHTACFRCPQCAILIERIDDRVDASHYDRFRIRCPHCQCVFCSNCLVQPYHDSRTCKEFERELNTPLCRFCRKPAAANMLCGALDCELKNTQACQKINACGHFCAGVRDESACMPCMHADCADDLAPQTATDACLICHTESLAEAPCVQLGCGHVFHCECVRLKLRNGWPTDRITFGFARCPICTAAIDHEEFAHELAKIAALRVKIVQLGREALAAERHGVLPAVSTDDDDDDERVLATAAFYMCSKCQKPYYGGRVECADRQPGGVRAAGESTQLTCALCSSQVSNACPIHSTEFIQQKCQFCCRVATWRCWGTTSFCQTCHDRQLRGERMQLLSPAELPLCLGSNRPLRIPHPPPGTPFSLGCFLCRIDRQAT